MLQVLTFGVNTCNIHTFHTFDQVISCNLSIFTNTDNFYYLIENTML